MQPEGHTGLLPPHTYGAQLGVPVAPAGAGMQRPLAAGALQTSQAPVQAVSQQVPSTQNPEVHSVGPVHEAPAWERGRHAPDAAQYELLTHWLELVQPRGQLLEAPLHTKGAHEGLPGTPASVGEQVPLVQLSQAPSQRVSQHTPSTQLPERHCTSAVQADASAR